MDAVAGAAAEGAPSRSGPRGTRAGRPALETVWIALVTLACLLPFVGKALHIDDPFYVWVARHMVESPADFFGLTVNWDGTEQPLAAVNKNPPLISAFTAAIGLTLGWSEVALHLGFLLPALGVTLLTAALARRLGAPALPAAVGCLACPVFLVSATSVMSDVGMLALFCGSVLLWLRGLDEGRVGWLWASAALAALCALTKYFGIALLPLLLAVGYAREGRIGAWALPLALPLLVLLGYELYTAEVYGQGLLLRAAGFSAATRPEEVGRAERVLVATIFAGGALIPALFAAPWVLTRRSAMASAALFGAVLAACHVRGSLAGVPLTGEGEEGWNLIAHVTLFAASGAVLLVLLARELRRPRDPASLLLGLWGLGTLVFAAGVNYTVNGRALLPLAPVLGIVLARHWSPGSARSWLPVAALAPALVVALAAAAGDAALAQASRTAAVRIADDWQGHTRALWFEGQWGFQHYLQETGARAVDLRRSVLRPGDVLATPRNAKARLHISPRAASHLEEIAIPVAPVTTMALATATGFYAIQWGPLPWRWLPGHQERFEVRRIEHLLLFERDPVAIERRRTDLRRALADLSALFALEARDWPEPIGAGGSTASAWEACRPRLRTLVPAVDRECAWCSTGSDCLECREIAAERTGLGAECRTLLAQAVVAQASRCRETRDELLSAIRSGCGDCRDASDCTACRLRVGERSPAGPTCALALEHELRLAGGELP